MHANVCRLSALDGQGLRLSQHRFSLLSQRGVAPSLPLTNPARAKLKALGVYRTLEDGDTSLSLAECLFTGDRSQQKHQQAAEGPLDHEKIAYSSVSMLQQPRQCTVSSIACDDHPNEPVRFFCKTCGGKCICGECGLSLQHQRHLVVTADTAWRDTLTRIEGELSPSVDRFEEETEGARGLLQDRRTEWASALQEDKQLLSLTRSQLHRRLASKQEEVLSTLASYVRDFCAECEGFKAFIEEKINIIEARAQMVSDGKGSIDPRGVLDFVSREFQNTEDFIEANIPKHFLHLPQSREALLDNMQQVTEDLVGELASLRSKILAAK